MREIRTSGSGAPIKTGARKQVSEMKRRGRNVERVLPQEESTPGKSIPCAARGDLRSEA
jgi:hypothetical protein